MDLDLNDFLESGGKKQSFEMSLFFEDTELILQVHRSGCWMNRNNMSVVFLEDKIGPRRLSKDRLRSCAAKRRGQLGASSVCGADDHLRDQRLEQNRKQGSGCSEVDRTIS